MITHDRGGRGPVVTDHLPDRMLDNDNGERGLTLSAGLCRTGRDDHRCGSERAGGQIDEAFHGQVS
jgi:hypothetical protein